MSIAWTELTGVPRLLMEARLEPVQGERFQPTGFPDLGPATYESPNGTQMLLIESQQSMGNRLEAVCWNEAADDVVQPLLGMPYVKVRLWNGQTTSSVQEAHRLNSPYIISDTGFAEALRKLADLPERRRGSGAAGENEDEGAAGLFDRGRLARAAFHYDPCSVLHGVFLEKLDGRARLQRCVSAFIEARNVRHVASGGVKNDRIAPNPRALGLEAGQGAKEGFGNVPFHRIEFTAEAITSYFSVDMAQIRAYGLEEAGERFLIALALWKVQRFLDSGCRLRTACDFALVDSPEVTRPASFPVPVLTDLEEELALLIKSCADEGLFAMPPVTEVAFQPRPSTSRRGRTPPTPQQEEGEGTP